MSEPNYSFENLAERAAAARAANKDFVDKLERAYLVRTGSRRDNHVPVLAVLGYGRAGKDTAAKYLCNELGITYDGSSSNNLAVFVGHMVGLSPEQAFKERHQHRDFWIAAGHAVRQGDLTILCRFVLAKGDMAVGLRGKEELHGCQRDGLVKYSIWIDNPRVPRDETVEFGPDDCDIVIPNHGSITELYRKLDKFCTLLQARYFYKESES